MMRPPRSQRGFTLVELIVGMVITAILAGMIAVLIGAPVDSYLLQARNNELSEASGRITRTLTKDLNRALPNSVRIRNVGNRAILQMLEVTDVVYFVPQGANPLLAPQQLDFINADANFVVYGDFSHTTKNPSFLVVNNEGQGAGKNAYLTSGVIVSATVPAGTAATANPINLNPAFRFTNGAPTTNRMFVVSTPITYICNRATGLLQRFTDHAINAATPVNESSAQLAGADVTVVATGVTGCSFACVPGTPNTPCLNAVTLSMSVSRGVAPNTSTIQVLHQVAVENTP